MALAPAIAPSPMLTPRQHQDTTADPLRSPATTSQRQSVKTGDCGSCPSVKIKVQWLRKTAPQAWIRYVRAKNRIDLVPLTDRNLIPHRKDGSRLNLMAESQAMLQDVSRKSATRFGCRLVFARSGAADEKQGAKQKAEGINWRPKVNAERPVTSLRKAHQLPN